MARGPTLAGLRASGLIRSGLFGRFDHPAGSFRTVEEPREIPGPVAHLLVATKSFDSASVARSLAGAPCIGPDTRIVLCQNGWGLAEQFRPFFAERSIWNARVITGFRRPEPHHVEITVHAEPVHIGSLFGEPGAGVAGLCRTLAAGGLPCAPTDTIARDLWAKLLYNGLLNPLGALFEVPYGELAEHPEIRRTMRELALETFAVMGAAGYETHWPDADAYLEDFYARLLPPTASHESSTLQDLRAGRRTEIDALTGAVVSLGEEHGTPTPVSRTLLAMVHFIEARRQGSHRA